MASVHRTMGRSNGGGRNGRQGGAAPPPPLALGGQSFTAGPMCGGKPIKPCKKMGEATVKVPDTSKFLIFVVDLQYAKMLDSEPKQLKEMQEDITDALGVTTEGKTLQVIFAGHDGPERTEIDDDKALNEFFKRFDLHQGGELSMGGKGEKAFGAVGSKRFQDIERKTMAEVNEN